VAAGLLGESALGGDGTALLGRVSEHVTELRASNLLWVISGVGIIALAALLYAVLGNVDRPLALIAFGWWLAVGTVLAVGALSTYGLLAVAAGTAGAAAPGPERGPSPNCSSACSRTPSPCTCCSSVSGAWHGTG
jgi:hypothetical protein